MRPSAPHLPRPPVVGPGEQPMDRWEGLATDELAERWGSPAVHAFASVSSTNDVARRLADAGAPAGTVVVAEEQQVGRGRAGRGWDSPARLGLWLSLVVRPASGSTPGALSLGVAVSVAEALDPLLPGAGVGLKWPNDLVVDARKLGGILCEATWERDSPRVVIVGIGINVAHRPDQFPPSIRDLATSLRIVAGAEVPRLDVASAVIPAVTRSLAAPLVLDAALLEAFHARDVLRGREVVVTEPASGDLLARGLALGVAPDGSLLLRGEAGAIRSVHSGTVRPLDR